MLAVCGLVPASWGGRKSAGVTHSLDPCSGVEVGTHVLGMCASPCVLIFSMVAGHTWTVSPTLNILKPGCLGDREAQDRKVLTFQASVAHLRPASASR